MHFWIEEMLSRDLSLIRISYRYAIRIVLQIPINSCVEYLRFIHSTILHSFQDSTQFAYYHVKRTGT